MKTLYQTLKKQNYIAVVILFIVSNVQFSFGQLFQQNFTTNAANLAAVNAAYSSATPGTTKFNAFAASGTETVSTNSGVLTFNRTTNSGTATFSRTTDLAPAPATMKYSFNLSVTAATSQATAAQFKVGSNFSNANTPEVNTDTYAHFAVDQVSGNKFKIRYTITNSNTNTGHGGPFNGTCRVNWFLNNTGSSVYYQDPTGAYSLLPNDKMDIWVDSASVHLKVHSQVAVTTPSLTAMTDLKFILNLGSGTVSISSMLIDFAIPTINCPTPSTVTHNTDAGDCSALVTLTQPTVAFGSNCTPISYINDYNGTNDATDIYAVGTNVVTWTITDACGNQSFCSQNVTVSDHEAPVFTCLSNQIRNTDPTFCTYTVTNGEFNADTLVTDNCLVDSLYYTLTGVTTGTGTDLDGIVFNKGVTHVKWTAKDWVNNGATCMFDVTVNDAEPPHFTVCPTDASKNTDSGVCTYTVSGTEFNSTAADNCGTVSSLSYILSGATSGSGSMLNSVVLNKGITHVRWTASDPSGNIDSCHFNVTVTDNQPPTITCVGNQSKSANHAGCTYSPSGGEFDPVTQNDNCTYTISYSINAGTPVIASSLNGVLFPIGLTNVSWIIDDGTNAPVTCSFTVTVDNNHLSALASNDGPMGHGSTLNLTSSASGGSGTITYGWTGPNSFTSSSQNPSIINATGAATGTYTVTATDANGCTTTATTFAIVYHTSLYVNDATLTGPYASAAGNNANAGRTIDPLATISFAVSVAQAGDSIFVDNGSYPENVVVSKRLLIRGGGNTAAGTVISNPGTIMTLFAGSSPTNRMVLDNVRTSGGTTGISSGSSGNNYITIKNVVSTGNSSYGLLLNTTSDVNIDSSYFTSGNAGIKIPSTESVSNMTVNHSHFDNNTYGWYADANSGIKPSLDNVTVTNSTFNFNSDRGIYTERLSNALFENDTVHNSGTTASSNGAGMDINLKWKAYSNIEFRNMVMDGCGTGSISGSGLNIKGRNDVSPYIATPASVSNLIINNCQLTSPGVFSGTNLTTLALGNNISTITFSGTTTFTGTGRGLTVYTDNATPTIDLGTSSFSGTLASYIAIGSPRNITATSATFNGSTGAGMSLTDLFTTEDKIIHKIDYSPLGFVSVKANNDYVTVNSFISPATTAPSIQRGVDAASATWTVNVAAGTYTESVSVTKTLNIRGAQADNCAAGRAGAESIINCADGIGINASNVTLNGFTIQNQTSASGPGFGYAVYMAPPNTGTQLLNNIIKNNVVGSSISNAGASPSQVLISCNWFDSNNNPGAAGGAGIYTDEFTGGGVISNVMIDNNKFTGHIDDGGIDFSVSTTANAATGITISHNLFDGNRRAAFLDHVVSSTFNNNDVINSTGTGTGDVRIYGGVTSYSILNNNFSNGAPHAIRITNDGGPQDNSTVIANDNSFTGYSSSNVAIEVTAGCTGTLNATCNWYGTTNSSTIATLVAGSVTFSPWLTSGGNSASIGFTPTGSCNGTPLSISLVSQTNVTCNGGNNGAIDISVSGGSGNYSYSWSNSAATEDISGLIANPYTVTVTDLTYGGTASASYTITQPTAVTVNTITNSGPVGHGSTLNFTSSASGGTGAISYSWTGPNSFTSSSQNPSIINATGAATGTYTVTATDASLCTDTATTSAIVYNTTLYVNDAHTGTDITAIAGDDTHAGTLASPLATIAFAVSVAQNGDTIIVDGGSYPVTTALNIDKGLDIRGAYYGVAAIAASRGAETVLTDSRAAATNPGAFSISTNSLVNIDGFTFNGSKIITGQPANATFRLRNNRMILQAMPDAGQTSMIYSTGCRLLLDHNYFETTGYNASNSAVMQVAGGYSGSGTTDSMTVTNNIFKGIPVLSPWNNGNGQSTLQLNFSDCQGTVSGNTFDGVDIGVIVANNSGNLSISGNTFENMHRDPVNDYPNGDYAAGILFFTPSFSGPVIISGNNFQSSDCGIRSSSFPGGTETGTNIQISTNTFSGNLYDIVAKYPTATLTLDGDNTMAGTTLTSASLSDLFSIEDKIVHKVDYSSYGLVIVKASNLYVTTNSYFTPAGTTSALIQRGVDAASATWTVNAGPGSFTGQVEINKALTLLGQGSGTTNIVSPASLPLFFTTSANNYPVVYAHGASNVFVKSLTVDGAGQGNANYRLVGIGYSDAAGTVRDCEIKDVRDNPISGNQAGNGIVAYAQSGTPRTLNFIHNNIHDFQKNATVFAGNDLTVNCDSNTVTGAGNVTFIAQNGIQISSGATGSITHNTISGFSYTPGTAVDCGVLLFAASGSVACTNNTVNNCQVGIYYISSNGSISSNSVNYTNMGSTPYWYGIDVEDGTTTVTNNEVNGGGNGAGIEADAASGENTSTSIENNKVDNCDEGLVAWSEGTGILISPMQHNSITNNGSYAIHNYGAASQDVSCNWYGTIGSGAVAALISGPVTYTGYLLNGTDDQPGTTGFQTSAPCGTVTQLYVNDDDLTGDHIITPDVVGNDANLGTIDSPFRTIQHAIDVASPGDIIYVDAGTYREDITISTDSLTLEGSNFGNNPTAFPNQPRPEVESTIEPASSDPDIYSATAEVNLTLGNVTNVKIDGFTFNGNNPTLTSGVVNNGEDVDAAIAIGAFDNISNSVISNNIFTNTDYAAVNFENDNPSAVVTTDNSIVYNLFDNLLSDNNVLTYNWGIGIVIQNNAYCKIENNWMTRVRIGIQTGNYNLADFGTAQNSHSISSNTIESSILGIWHNLAYQTASSFDIENNTLTSYSGSSAINEGIEVSSVQTAVGVNLSDNNVTGANVGIDLWNNPTTSYVTVSGGTLTNCNTGVMPNNWDGYYDNADPSAYVIDGVTIQTPGRGIWVKDNSANTNASKGVAATITNCTINNASVAGIYVTGAQASAAINNNASTISGALVGVDIDSTGSASVANNRIINNGTGIRVKNSGTMTSCTENFITGNTGDGIKIEADAGAIGGINDNDLSINNGYKINNLTGTIIAATCNWLGSNIAADVADSVNGPLTYIPYLSNGTDNGGLASDGFQQTGTCTQTCPLTINSISSSNVSCYGSNDGSATVNISGAITPSYLWSNTQVTQTITGLVYGTYTVTVSDINGCTATLSKLVDQPILVTLSASHTNVSCNGAADGTLSASASAGATITVNGLPLSNPYGPGSYLIVASAPNGNADGYCTHDTTIVITEPILVTLSASHTNVSCNGAADGTLSASASAGATITVNGLPLSNPYGPGSYLIVASAPNGNADGYCTHDTTIVITEPILVTLSASHTNVSCNGAADGTLSASASAGATITVNGLPLSNPYGPGSYLIVASAPNGNADGYCTHDTTIVITEPILVTLSASHTNVSCNGAADGTLSASASAGATITVNGLPLSNPYGPGSYLIVASAPNGNADGYCTHDTTIVITEPILVTLSASHTNVSCNGAADGTLSASASAGATITVNGLPLSNPYGPGSYLIVASAPNGNADGYCTHDTTIVITEPILVTLSASHTNVSCNGAADGTLSASASAGATITVNGLPLSNPYGPGSYLIVASAPNGNADGYCTHDTTIVITEPILVTLSASHTNVSCNGAADGTLSASASAGATITVNGLPLSNPYGPGSYLIVASAPNGNADGYCTHDTTIVITEPILVTLSASHTNVSCNGAADGTLSASASAGATITVNGLPLSNPYGPGSYLIVASAPNGNADGYCTHDTTIVITEPILVTLSASHTNVSCNGAADGTLSASASAGATITVNGLPLSNPYGPGSYLIVASAPNGNADGYCTHDTTIVITEPILVTLSASHTNVSCNGAADGTLSASASAGATITVNGLPLSNPYGPGSYLIVASAPNGNADGYCTHDTTIVITEPILVTLSASHTNVSCNGAADGTLSASASAGATITVNGLPLSNPYGPGSYLIVASAPNGNADGYCTHDTTIVITEPILVTLSASHTNVSCNGAADGTLSASASAGATITVNGLPLSNPYGPGSYLIVASAPNGNADGYCTHDTTIVITEPILVTLSASHTNVSCNGAADGTLSASASAGATITVNGLPLSNPYGPGSYLIVASAPNGNADGYCTHDTTIVITEPILVTLSASHTNVSCNGAADGTLSASASAGATITVNGLPLSNPYGPGSYLIVASAPNGNADGYCTHDTTIVITEPILVTLSASHTNVSCNGAADGTLSASASAGATITVNGLPLSNPYGPGSYLIVASAPNGNADGYCTHDTTIVITEPILVTLSASHTNVSCNGAADGTLSASASAGATITVNGLPLSNPYGPGSYLIVASAPNGNADGYCTHDTTIVITEPILVTLSASHTNVSCNGAADGTLSASASAGATITVNGLPLSNPYGPGSYLIVASAPNGNADGYCTHDTTIVITEPILVTLSASHTNVSCNGAADGTLSASASAGATITVNGLPLSNPYGPGSYLIVASAPNGNADGYCTHDTTIVITEPILVTLSASHTNVSCNGAADGTLSASASAGATITVNGLPLSNPYGPGSYLIVASAPNGNADGYCTHDTTIVITEPILVTLSASHTNVSCNGAADGTLSASASAGATITVNGLPLSNPYGPGSYLIVASAPNGNADGYCTHDTTIVITEPILVTLSASHTNVSCNGAADGTLSASASAGATITVNGLPLSNPYGPGSYLIVASAPNGNADGYCTHDTTIVITEPILVTLSASHTNVSCNGAADGTLSASASAGATITVNGLPLSNPYGPGSYLIVASAPNGNADGYCTHDTTIVITEPILVTLSASHTNVSCNGAADGTLSASASAGATITVNGLPLSNPYGPGSYLIVASAPNGNADGYCTHDTTIVITEPILVTLSASHTNVSCNGAADGTLSASASAGATITVNGLPLSNPYGPGSYLIVASAPNGNADGYCTHDTTIVITEPILVTLSASHTNVSCNGAADGTLSASASAGATITVNGLPLSNPYGPGSYLIVASAPNGNADGYCTHDTTIVITEPILVTLSASHTNVSCNGAADGTLSASASAGATITVNGLPLSNPYGPGSYLIVASAPNGNADGYCTHDTTIVITEPILVTLSASHTNVSCNGAADGTLSASASAGATITVNGLPLSNPYGPGSYLIVASAPNGNADGYCTHDTTIVITEPILVTLSASHTNVSCNGAADGTLSASASAGATITVNGLPLSNPYGPGSYLIVASAPNGNADGYCTHDTTIVITEPILVTLSASHTNVSCNGAADGTLSASASAGATITVNGLPLSNPYGPGSYLIVASAPNGNADGYCTHDTTIVITEPILVTLSASHTNVSCNGAADGTLSASASAGATITVNGLPLSNPYGPGSYLIVASAPNGNADGYCTHDTTIVITEPILVTLSASHTNVSCNGAADGTLSASASAGATITVNGLPLSNPYGPGSYLIVASAPNGNADGYCTHDTTIVITEPILVTLSASHTNVSCNGAADGTLSASASAGATITVNGLPLSNPYGPGSYLIVASAPNGNADGYCTHDTTIVITEPILVTLSASHTNVSCNGAADGTLSASASAGATITVNGLPLSNPYGPGSYLIVASAPNGNADGYCTHDTTIVITEPILVTLSASHTNVSCNGAADGTLSASASAGATITVNGLPLSNPYGPGSYLIVASAPNGNADGYCTHDTTIVITEPAVLSATVNSTNVTCNGANDGTITISSPTGGYGTYQYSINGGTSWQNTGSYTGLANATYDVRIRDAAHTGCVITLNGALVITQPAVLNATVNSTNVTCNGANDGTITITSPTGGYGTYQYSIDGGTSWQNTGNYTGLPAATYDVRIRDAAHTGCVIILNGALVITQPAAIIAYTVTGGGTYCSGGSGLPVGLSNSQTGVNYELYRNSIATGNVQPGNTGNTVSFGNQTIVGTYTAVATNPTTLCTNNMSGSVSIAIDNMTVSLSSTNHNGVNVSCFGGSNGDATATPSNSVGTVHYLWSTSATTQTITGRTAGTYTVTVNDDACSTIMSITLTQPSAAANDSVTKTDVVCFGAADGTSKAWPYGGTAPYTYLWNGGSTAQTRTALAPGNYTVTVTDVNLCAVAPKTVTIAQPSAALNVTTSKTNVTPCFGGTNGTANSSTSGGWGGYTYLWSNAKTTANVTGLAAGTYTLTVTDNHGCSKVVNVSITQPTQVTVSFSVPSTNHLTATGSGGTAGYTYLWNTGSTAQTITTTSGTTYTCTATDTKGCKGTNSTVAARIAQTGEPVVTLFDASVYPNPTMGAITVDFSASLNSQYHITLTDYAGRIIIEKSGLTTEGDNKFSYDLTNLSPGIYFVKVMRDDQLKVLRVILQ